MCLPTACKQDKTQTPDAGFNICHDHDRARLNRLGKPQAHQPAAGGGTSLLATGQAVPLLQVHGEKQPLLLESHRPSRKSCTYINLVPLGVAHHLGDAKKAWMAKPTGSAHAATCMLDPRQHQAASQHQSRPSLQSRCQPHTDQHDSWAALPLVMSFTAMPQSSDVCRMCT